MHFLPYMVQMTIFLAGLNPNASPSATARVEGIAMHALQVLAGIDTAANGAAGPGRSPTSDSSATRATRYSALPFLNPDFPSSSSGGSAGAAAASRSPPPGSVAARLGSWLPSSSSSSSAAAGAALPTLRELLDRSPLDGFVTSSHTVGIDRIRSSIYVDPTDYFEGLMVLSLSYWTHAQWNAAKWGLLWRILAQAKQGLALELLAEDATASTSASVATGGTAKKEEEKQARASGAGEERDEDMGVKAAAAPASAAAAVSSSSAAHEGKESESSTPRTFASLSPDQQSTVSHAQLELLRPLLLFWSLVDELHAVLAAPADSSYTPEKSESFVSSTTSAWIRRWRRGFARAAQVSTFRSLVRRDHAIQQQLIAQVLPTYEKRTQIKTIHALLDDTGVSKQLAGEGFTSQQLMDALTAITVTRS